MTGWRQAVVYAAVLGGLFSFAAQASDRTPDELFPEQSRQGMIRFQQTLAEAAQQRSALAADPAAWDAAEIKGRPATYGDLAVLKKEIDLLKAQIETIKSSR